MGIHADGLRHAQSGSHLAGRNGRARDASRRRAPPSGAGVRPVELPGDVEEVWAWEVAGSDVTAAALVRYADITTRRKSCCSRTISMAQESFVDRSREWTVTPLRGLLLVDAASSQRTGDLDAATVQRFDVDSKLRVERTRGRSPHRREWLRVRGRAARLHATPWGSFAARNTSGSSRSHRWCPISRA